MNEIRIDWYDYERTYSIGNVLDEMIKESTAKDPESFMIENSEQIESFQNAIRESEMFDSNDTDTELALSNTMWNLLDIGKYYRETINGKSNILKDLAKAYFSLWYESSVGKRWTGDSFDVMNCIAETVERLNDMRKDTLNIN